MLDDTRKISIMAPVLTMTQRNDNAGIAQLVERNLAKVEVASSNLVSRSKYKAESSDAFGFFYLLVHILSMRFA